MTCRRLVFCVVFASGLMAGFSAYAGPVSPRPKSVGYHNHLHKAVYNADGKLMPWTSWNDAITREMNYYLNCPLGRDGYPIFVYNTFLNAGYKPYRTDVIPCTQDGMGILSYLKYYRYIGKSNPKVLEWAKKMGDYLVKETLTPDKGAYPRFTRSTGVNTDFPLKVAAQDDMKVGGPNCIEPDKGGIAAYALLKLYDATHDKQYLYQAIQNADDLVKNMRKGDAMHAPWPFRVDCITGKHWGERNGDMVYILRTFDNLLARGYTKYRPAREALWHWIKTYQLTAPDSRDASLWVQFFEDQDEQNNRNSWTPLEMARYLIERKDKLDPDWKADARKCIQFALKHFSGHEPGGVTTMFEQDTDLHPWGGACSKLGGVAAMFYAAGGGKKYKEMAYENLTWMTYFISDSGCPAQQASERDLRLGGWQEDCHTDVIHNFMDAIAAVPAWGAKGAPRAK